MEKMEQEKDKHVWIIRYEDGALASYYGDEADAIRAAEEKKDLYGGGYIIIK